ncbi:TPA: hypothetical protein I7171_22670 [Vibrio vulnificus]|nr:hypothetical protein [Vibrio vulnificus]HAT7741655.1 hypothetical protein [Vibrio vulnificus]
MTYEAKLSFGTFVDGDFKEDTFSKPTYTFTEDKRYIVGHAKRGSVIGITSVAANDASGNYLGTFTPCQKTLVFQLPSGNPATYITELNYEWNNVVIYPRYQELFEQAKSYFINNSESGVEELSQGSYYQLHAELYHGCRKPSGHPYALWRPY